MQVIYLFPEWWNSTLFHLSVVSFITTRHSMVSVNRSFCEENKNPIMFPGAVPEVPEVLHGILQFSFCSDGARDSSTGDEMKTDEDSFHS